MTGRYPYRTRGGGRLLQSGSLRNRITAHSAIGRKVTASQERLVAHRASARPGSIRTPERQNPIRWASMTALLTHPEHLAWLRQLMEGFVRATQELDLGAPVPSCPGWSVGDLVRHLGRIHGWAAAAITEQRNVDDPFEPPADSGLSDWYAEQASTLIKAIERTPIDTDVWTFGPPPHRVTFWSRRQAHETAIHLWDAHAASGSGVRIDPALAKDGVEEVLTMFFPRQVALGRTTPLTRRMELVCPVGEGAGRWTFGPGSAGEPASHGPTEVVVTGPAPVLQLLLWKRKGLDDPGLSVEGDFDAAREVLAHRLTP